MKLLSVLPFRFFTLLFLFALAFGMPLGKIVMSIATLGISTTWLLEGRFKEKWSQLIDLKYTPLLLSGLFFIPVLWLINSSNLTYALRQIELSLPLLAFPIILGTSPHINQKVFKQTLILFLLGVITSTLISFLIYVKIIPSDRDISNVRNISIFMSHIRLSLFICLAIVISIYLFIKEKGAIKWGAFAATIWLTLFIILLKAGTAWVILLIELIILPVYLGYMQKKHIYSLLSLFVFGIVTIGFWMSYNNYHYINPKENKPLEEFTENGEKYHHDLNSKFTENGYYLFRYIAVNEVEKAWKNRSNIHIDSLDKKGQPIRATLYRYLTSKGLHKDSLGVYSLTLNEITQIENGRTTSVSLNPITSRLYEVYYDLDLIVNNNLEQGHTLAQRVAYLKIGWQIAKDHFWFGTGTGDVRDEYEAQYKNTFTEYDKKNQLKALNQFISILVAYGFIGLVLWLIVWIYPMLKIKKQHPIYFFFVIIIVISFLSDNTLHRQAGITLFAFFNSLLLFYPAYKKQKNITT